MSVIQRGLLLGEFLSPHPCGSSKQSLEQPLFCVDPSFSFSKHPKCLSISITPTRWTGVGFLSPIFDVSMRCPGGLHLGNEL